MEDILIDALETIAKYDKDATGCNAPFIAQEALRRYQQEALLRYKKKREASFLYRNTKWKNF